MDKDFANTLVIDISARQTAASRHLIPPAKHFPLLSNPAGSLKRLRQLVTSYKDESFFTVLIFNESGKQYATVEKYLNRIGLDAFYLEGGLAGYQNYLAGVLLSRKPRPSRIKTAGNCKPCGKKVKEETQR